MLSYNDKYMGDPFLVEAAGEDIVIFQGSDDDHQVTLQVEDVDELIRKVNRVKNEIIAAKVREANKQLFQ